MSMSHFSKTLYIKHIATRVGYRLAKEALGVFLETSLYLCIIPVWINEGTLYAEFLHRNAEKIERSAINSVGGDEVVTCLTNIEHSIEVRCLSRAGEHSPYSTLKGADFLRHSIICGISKTCVEISFILKVEEACHLL